MKKLKWTYDADEPNNCMACPEELNGLWYTIIYVGRAKFHVNACSSCAKKAGGIM